MARMIYEFPIERQLLQILQFGSHPQNLSPQNRCATPTYMTLYMYTFTIDLAFNLWSFSLQNVNFLTEL